MTGASRGIGRVIALRLATAGYTIAVNYRSKVAEANAVVREIESSGGRALAIQADVSDPDGARALYARTVKDLGPVRVLDQQRRDHPGSAGSPDVRGGLGMPPGAPISSVRERC